MDDRNGHRHVVVEDLNGGEVTDCRQPALLTRAFSNANTLNTSPIRPMTNVPRCTARGRRRRLEGRKEGKLAVSRAAEAVVVGRVAIADGRVLLAEDHLASFLFAVDRLDCCKQDDEGLCGAGRVHGTREKEERRD